MRQKIAVIGTGIAGLGAAWSLHQKHDVIVYEAASDIGGHSRTQDVVIEGGRTIPVDTGFIVYNDVTYPNLSNLFEHLQVETRPSEMSFAFSLDRQFEYGASLKGILGQPRNLIRRSFWRMMLDIDRFRRSGAALAPGEDESIDDLLDRHNFSREFRNDYLYPMTGAIWSASQMDIRRFSARMILRFLSNHGLIEIVGRPKWRTVVGGSREYVRRLVRPFRDRILTATPVSGIERTSDGVVVRSPGRSQIFDQVVLATHTDQALAILGGEATGREASLLSSIPYAPNTAILHSDVTLMPANRKVWSSWNAMAASSNRDARPASITYWMNRLQDLHTSHPIFVSLNPHRRPDPNLTHGTYEYSHPQFDQHTANTQREIAMIQGANRTWYAGAWMGYGFHEDGLQSGLNVAAALGSPSPWEGRYSSVSCAPRPSRRMERV